MTETSSTAVTHGVRVTVRSQYVEAQSYPSANRYVFAYTVLIKNESKRVVRLETRHWIVTHGDGRVEEVRGAGVIGEQPTLEPGQGFQYTSGCLLRTPRGTMRGTYGMVANGEPFDVEVATFALEVPFSLN